jgi:hypothetical protein
LLRGHSFSEISDEFIERLTEFVEYAAYEDKGIISDGVIGFSFADAVRLDSNSAESESLKNIFSKAAQEESLRKNTYMHP